MKKNRLNQFCCALAGIFLALSTITGCGTTEGNIALGALGITVVGGQSPSSEIQQIYYLGVFDPRDQLPPTVYRVRVHGQASFISSTKFASGWVPAHLIDALGSDFHFKKGGSGIEVTKEGNKTALPTGRRLMMFGPEGFREAPKNHRLVVVMGSDPEKFFEAIDQTLGSFSTALHEMRSTDLNQEILQAAIQINGEQRRLDDFLYGRKMKEAKNDE